MNEADCNSYEVESETLRAEAIYFKLSIKRDIVKIGVTKLLQFFFEDIINMERTKFAKEWKTYFEKSGGFGGWKGYLTIFYHFSQVSPVFFLNNLVKIIYLHIFLVFPMAWLYFPWHQQISINNFTGSLLKLVDINGIMNPASNIILIAGFVVVALILSFLFLNVIVRWLLYGFPAPSRGSKTPLVVNPSQKMACFFMWVLILITGNKFFIFFNFKRACYLELFDHTTSP